MPVQLIYCKSSKATSSTHSSKANSSILYTCNTAQQAKASSQEYGGPAVREPPLKPWAEVHVDCMGPWTFTVTGKDLCFTALTCIHLASALLEVTLTTTKTASQIARLFKYNWFA
jgi:hypothetical protein